jgi:hypothetical protein
VNRPHRFCSTCSSPTSTVHVACLASGGIAASKSHAAVSFACRISLFDTARLSSSAANSAALCCWTASYCLLLDGVVLLEACSRECEQFGLVVGVDAGRVHAPVPPATGLRRSLRVRGRSLARAP